ncbi:hypothetical protein H1R20_g4768, partial [Candolleomyces eurysporus]
MALHVDKVRLVEQFTAARTAVIEKTADSSGLRAQLEKVTKDQDRAKSPHYQTEFELERVKKALQDSKTELETSKRQLEYQAQELAHRRSQPQSPLYHNMQSPLGTSPVLELAPMSVLRGARLASVMRAEQDRFVKQINSLIQQGYTSFRLSNESFAHPENMKLSRSPILNSLSCPRDDLKVEAMIQLSILSSTKEVIIKAGTE